MSKFAELDLEHQIAQRLYTSATTALESARMVAEHKMMYINTFVRPAVPQDSRYPRRLLSWALITGGGDIRGYQAGSGQAAAGRSDADPDVHRGNLPISRNHLTDARARNAVIATKSAV